VLNALKLYWKTLGDLYYEIVILGAVNLLWTVLLIPIVTAPPATAALFYVTNRLANGEDTKIRDFFVGFRTYFGKGWQIGATAFGITLILVFNIVFYYDPNLAATMFGNPTVQLVTIMWLYFMVFWVAIMMFLFPLMIEQENKSILLLLKNATILVVDNLGTSSIAFVLILLTLVLNLLLGGIWVFILFGSFIALYENRLVITLLEKYRSRIQE
jgi:hypothetical protein